MISFGGAYPASTRLSKTCTIVTKPRTDRIPKYIFLQIHTVITKGRIRAYLLIHKFIILK